MLKKKKGSSRQKLPTTHEKKRFRGLGEKGGIVKKGV